MSSCHSMGPPLPVLSEWGQLLTCLMDRLTDEQLYGSVLIRYLPPTVTHLPPTAYVSQVMAGALAAALKTFNHTSAQEFISRHAQAQQNAILAQCRVQFVYA